MPCSMLILFSSTAAPSANNLFFGDIHSIIVFWVVICSKKVNSLTVQDLECTKLRGTHESTTAFH